MSAIIFGVPTVSPDSVQKIVRLPSFARTVLFATIVSSRGTTPISTWGSTSMRPTSSVIPAVLGAPKCVILRALKGLGRLIIPLRDGGRERVCRGTVVASRRTVCDIIR